MSDEWLEEPRELPTQEEAVAIVDFNQQHGSPSFDDLKQDHETNMVLTGRASEVDE